MREFYDLSVIWNVIILGKTIIDAGLKRVQHSNNIINPELVYLRRMSFENVRSYMTEILPIRRKTLTNQSIFENEREFTSMQLSFNKWKSLNIKQECKIASLI